MEEPIVKTNPNTPGSGTFNVKRTPPQLPPTKRLKLSRKHGLSSPKVPFGIRNSDIESKSSETDSDFINDDDNQTIPNTFQFMPPPPPLNQNNTQPTPSDSLFSSSFKNNINPQNSQIPETNNNNSM